MKGMAIYLIFMTSSLANASTFDSAFERLKGLVGAWDVEGADRRVVYSLSGGGETLVEDVRGAKTMATFYHMDGGDLRLTHYCAAGNQPRMKAVSYNEARGILKFEFLDITNLSEPAAYHTRDLEIRFLRPDRVELEFSGTKKGEQVSSTLTLTRSAK